MIRVLLLDRYRETIDTYLQMWARPLDQKLGVVPYEALFPCTSIEGGVFIFSDLERLKDSEYERADVVARKIESAGGRVLNKPSRALRRYALLRLLKESGRNPFNVYREGEIGDGVKYPVFVRRERAHNGALTPLLSNRDELDGALAGLRNTSAITDDFLVIEYVHTADTADGLFRKYSAMLIGERLVPRHILFSREWIDKDADVVTDETVVEENEYLENFPHALAVREIFGLAGIDYGRIDYSVLDGKPVTWEVNTNPRILPSAGKCDPRRLCGQGISARRIREAFLELAESKSVTVSLAGCQGVEGKARMSAARRMIYAAARFWKWAGKFKTGRRLIEGLTLSIRLGKDQKN